MLKKTLPILEILPIIKEHVPRHKAILLFLLKEDQQAIKLFELLSESSFRSDDQARESLKMEEKAFSKICQKLHAALLQAILFIDTSAMEEYLGEILDGFKKISQMKLLRLLGASANAELLAQVVAKSGKKYRNQTLLYFGHDLLSSVSSDFHGDPALFEKHQLAFVAAKENLDTENAARALFQRTQVSFAKSRAAKKDQAPALAAELARLRPYFDKIDSHAFHFHFSLSEINYHLIALEYPEAFARIAHYLDYFSKIPGVYKVQLANLYGLKTACCVMLRRYEEGESAAEAGLLMTKPGMSGWYNLLIEYFYLSMHTGNFEKAAAIYRMGVEQKSFLSKPAFLQTHWRLLGAYLQIAFYFTNMPLPDERWFPKYKASKFANDMALFSQDKSGLNIAILIAQVLMQLREKKYDEIWERIDSMKKYRLRYTGENATRLGLFIHLLAQLPKVNFHKKPFQQKTAPIMRALEALPIDLTMQVQELEIIPLEMIYQMILVSLKDSKY